MTETLGTHLIVLIESYLMKTNMAGFKCFLDKSSPISIGRVNNSIAEPYMQVLILHDDCTVLQFSTIIITSW